MKFKKKSTSPTVTTSTREQGKVEKTSTVFLDKESAEGLKLGMIRVIITARLSANYNSVGVEIGGDIPYEARSDINPLDDFQNKFEEFYARVDALCDEKIETMKDVLGIKLAVS